ncbi:Cellulose biosynthesis protein BcsQ [Amphibacillus marinus]|uniref:Cellulose biosynthesis protein BcsQ n=1 Tax=Amphibacillus marinus TaxID=872970 RepID=A0A1H8R240_9BACI|nr:AAA family ATPase [Amphibacillus marinus]SEO60545.1 Cellulose biosynthesis protein BcsQ [Amphibacillus marinus]
MKKITMIVADQDRTYIESFARYIRNSEYAARFDIKLFSKREALQQFLLGKEPVNILLTTKDFLGSADEDGEIDLTVYLAEAEEGSEALTLRKYQPLGQLLAGVLKFYYEKDGTKQKQKKSHTATQVLATYSAGGGAGKTTTAFGLARELANQDHQVIYISLELVNSIPILFNIEDQPSSSPLLYYIKADPEQLAEQFEAYTLTDKKTAIDYFNFAPSAEEVTELVANEIETLIQTLVELNKYSYIVIDLDSSVNERTLAALSVTDHIYWLLNYDLYSFHKTSYLFEEWHTLLNDASLKDRVTFVLNRYTGQLDQRLESFNVDVTAFLPYVPEWKVLVKREQLTSVTVFNQHIQQLVTALHKQGVVLNES